MHIYMIGLLFCCNGQELTEHKYKSEALIHELSSKLRSVEEVNMSLILISTYDKNLAIGFC